jgi:hypothetical protein
MDHLKYALPEIAPAPSLSTIMNKLSEPLVKILMTAPNELQCLPHDIVILISHLASKSLNTDVWLSFMVHWWFMIVSHISIGEAYEMNGHWSAAWPHYQVLTSSTPLFLPLALSLLLISQRGGLVMGYVMTDLMDRMR